MKLIGICQRFRPLDLPRQFLQYLSQLLHLKQANQIAHLVPSFGGHHWHVQLLNVFEIDVQLKCSVLSSNLFHVETRAIMKVMTQRFQMMVLRLCRLQPQFCLILTLVTFPRVCRRKCNGWHGKNFQPLKSKGQSFKHSLVSQNVIVALWLVRDI